MSMLAEPRSRQKWSEDPRNTRWSSDKSKFGYQMLTKMGWSEGLGLGSTLQGGTSHVKIKKKRNAHGIGMKSSHDDDWIAHQDSFNALLSSLNTGDAPSDKKIQSLEDRVRVTRTKIMYSRFVKSKDLSRASNNDLACIFGQRSKSAPSTPQRSEDEEESLSDGSTASCPTQKRSKDQQTAVKTSTEHGFTTISSGVSVADYFAAKMAALKQGSKTPSSSTTSMATSDNEDTDTKNMNESESVSKKKKKKKKHRNVTFDITENSSAEENDENQNATEGECNKDKKSKKKKHKKSQISSDIVEDEEEPQEESVEVKKKKKKKKARLEEGADEQQYVICREKKEKSKDRVEERTSNQNTDEQSSSNSESPQTSSKSSKKSKKKKSKNVDQDAAEIESESKNTVDDETMTSSISKKSKKKKRRHEDTEELCQDNEGVVEERKKKRKKRHQSDGEDGGN